MVQRIKHQISNNTNKKKSRSQIEVESMEPWSIFITNPEKGPLDQDTVDCLREILQTDEYNNVVSLSVYRLLNGAILRNAQSLNPVSDLHLKINEMPPQMQAKKNSIRT